MLREKRHEDGRWRLENRYRGKTYFKLERIHASSRWNTLRALRALKWWDGAGGTGGSTMLVKVTVGSLGLDRNDNTPVMILHEAEGDRILPIWIGPSEASAIAIELADMSLARPMTHDLLVTIIRAFGGQLTTIAIDRREEGTYYAELFLGRDERRFTLDARPSDSVALALRTGAEILVAEDLLVPKDSVTGPRSTDPSDPSHSDRPENPPASS